MAEPTLEEALNIGFEEYPKTFLLRNTNTGTVYLSRHHGVWSVQWCRDRMGGPTQDYPSLSEAFKAWQHDTKPE